MFAKSRAARLRSSRVVRPAIDGLATRIVPAGISLNPATHVLTVTGSNSDNAIKVVPQGKNLIVTITTPGVPQIGKTLPRSQIGKVVINALGGNDTVTSLDFPIRVDAGSGNDTVHGSSSADNIFGNSGNDLIKSNGGNDEVYGGDNEDTVYGGAGKDSIDGGAGDDFLYGELDDDKLYGDSGVDQLMGGWGTDFFRSGAGFDIVYLTYGYEDFGNDPDDQLYEDMPWLNS